MIYTLYTYTNIHNDICGIVHTHILYYSITNTDYSVCIYRSVLKALNWVPADLAPVTEIIAGQEAGQGVITVVYNGRKMVDNTGGVLHQYGIRLDI